ncbi:MAG: ParB/RepB/Spo0J family partition protein [Candidatus Methanospirare jalkutatii]|nr:ParB/RepB/Spo0J family partition protein [Candidatus Methanospirare jalkutatii]
MEGRLEEIPLDKIYIGKGEARTRDVGKDIEGLRESIRRQGLLQPIVVYQVGDKYELIIGQRRYLAVKELGWDRIPAIVISPLDIYKAKIVSAAENIHRRELPYKDMIDVCDFLYERYHNINAVAEELGISPETVRNYLAHRLVPEPIKKMVEEGKLSRQDALKITKATASDIIKGNIEKAVKIAENMASSTPEEKRRIIEVAEEKPDLPPEKVVEEAKKRPRRLKLVIHLPEKYAKALQNAAEDLEEDIESVAKAAIIDWLSARYGV